ncbi:MAG TPA: PH domain-containing protein [Terriglobia bacterium]|nr:PH domain-containing protein [Terriglobia bacterium]
MGYVDNNLITGERVTYRGRLHWILFLKPVLMSVVLIVVIGVVLYAANVNQWLSSQQMFLAGLIGLCVAALPFLPAIIRYTSAEFSVTNKRVILKIGFIQSDTAEMFLNKIESVGVDQTVVGRMFGYGDIVIRGTGGSLEPFRGVSNPLEFRRQIQEQIGQSFESQGRTPN